MNLHYFNDNTMLNTSLYHLKYQLVLARRILIFTVTCTQFFSSFYLYSYHMSAALLIFHDHFNGNIL